MIAATLLGACSTGPGNSPTPRPTFDAVERFAVDGRPSGIAVEGGRVWVADEADHEVHVFDERRGDEDGAPVEVARNPISMASGDGIVWVGHAGGELTRIDVASRRATRQTVGKQLTDVVVDDGRVFVVDLEGSAAAEIDPATGDVERGVTLGEGAVRGTVGKGGLWVTGMDDAVSLVDLDQFVLRHVYPDVGPGAIGAAWDGSVVWAAIAEDGAIVDVEGKTSDEPVDVCRGPIEMASPQQGSLYVVCQDDRTLVHVSDGEVEGDPIVLGGTPRDIAVGSDALWVAAIADAGTENQDAVIRVEAS